MTTSLLFDFITFCNLIVHFVKFFRSFTTEVIKNVNISQELISSFTLLKEELATPLLNITAIPFQPRIGTMTAIAVTVLRKEAGGILTVITQT